MTKHSNLCVDVDQTRSCRRDGRSPPRKGEYPPVDNRRQLSHKHPNAVRLPVEDGFDGEAIFRDASLSLVDALAHYESQGSRFYPTAKDLARFSAFFQFNVYEALAFCVKGEWEACKWKEYLKVGNKKKYETFATFLDSRAPDKGFQIGGQVNALARKMYSALCAFPVGTFEGLERYDEAGFVEMTLAVLEWELHHKPVLGEAVRTFAAVERERLEVVHEGTLEQKRQYGELRIAVAAEEIMVRETASNLERLRVQHAQTAAKYFDLFGEQELRRAQLRRSSKLLPEMIKLKKADPTLTRRELEERAVELDPELTALDRGFMEARRWELTIGLDDEWTEPRAFPHHAPVLLTPLTWADELAAEAEQVRHVLGKIAMLTHPDTLPHIPGSQKLSPGEMRELTAFFAEVTAVRRSDLPLLRAGIDPGVRHLPRLLEILRQILLRLNHFAGTDVDVAAIEQGTTMADRIQWLRDRLQHLEDVVISTQIEIRVFRNNENYLRWKAGIAEDPDVVRNRLEQEAETLAPEVEALERELSQLFGATRHGNQATAAE